MKYILLNILVVLHQSLQVAAHLEAGLYDVHGAVREHAAGAQATRPPDLPALFGARDPSAHQGARETQRAEDPDDVFETAQRALRGLREPMTSIPF